MQQSSSESVETRIGKKGVQGGTLYILSERQSHQHLQEAHLTMQMCWCAAQMHPARRLPSTLRANPLHASMGVFRCGSIACTGRACINHAKAWLHDARQRGLRTSSDDDGQSHTWMSRRVPVPPHRDGPEYLHTQESSSRGRNATARHPALARGSACKLQRQLRDGLIPSRWPECGWDFSSSARAALATLDCRRCRAVGGMQRRAQDYLQIKAPTAAGGREHRLGPDKRTG